ncbi:Leo1-like protein-domain-containing protein [Zychaea mexicana]|uniref:Leo1-like protein-domain-containing protein n=1 Tax=Zychaea mexicana TaxID=64656 RepID=UPI0022FE2E23|nr:Leo1-like protein-domain-containing protein [Zychaea mexicana]KAI9495957.1 Leo1-like protein-domain-containing protein [Zychaea mexicana]
MSDDDGHDFGNLFGSGDEASDLEGEQSLSPSPGPQARSPSPEANAYDSDEQSDNERKASKRPARQLDSDNDETSGRNDDFDNNDEEDYGSDQDYGTQKKQRIEVEVRMPSLPLPVTSDGKFYLAKVPRFLDIETEPFDLEQIRAQNEGSLGQGQDERVLQQMEHTLRWRLGVDDYGDTITESNTHFVEWEDGTTSLLVGNQLFDATRKTLGKEEHTYLLAHQTSSGVLESQLEVTDQMTFRPYDIHSDTHRQLSGSVSEQAKKIKTKMFFTEKDPEAVRNSVEKEEQERQKAQKKLESQRKRADDRYTTTSHRVTDNYEYDDFVDDEDEEEEEEQEYSSGEEEERERRLTRLKRTADF